MFVNVRRMFEISEHLSETTYENVRNLPRNELLNFAIYLLRVGIYFSQEYSRLPFNDENLFNIWLIQSKKMERFNEAEQELAFPIHITPRIASLADSSEDTINKIRELPSHVCRRIIIGYIRRVLPVIQVPEEIYIDYLLKQYSD